MRFYLSHNNSTSLFAVCISIIGVFFSSHSLACTNPRGTATVTFNLGKVEVPRDAAIGSVLATQTLPTSNYGWCWASDALIVDFYESSFRTLSNISGVYQTNIPGVGIRRSITVGNSKFFLPLRFNMVNSTDYLIRFHVELIKTGTAGSGALTSSRIALSSYQGSRNITHWDLAGTSIQSVACSVTSPNIIVPLGAVSRNSFTGVGSTANEKAFTIPLNCDAGVKINLTIDGAADSSNVAGLLALSSSGSVAVAKGVGVQIRHAGTPVSLGRRITIGTAASRGVYAIPLTARFYQSAATVTAGQANSTATFIMTYN